MAGYNELKIKVDTKICVDRPTAECCLKLVELYLMENKDIRLENEWDPRYVGCRLSFVPMKDGVE